MGRRRKIDGCHVVVAHMKMCLTYIRNRNGDVSGLSLEGKEGLDSSSGVQGEKVLRRKGMKAPTHMQILPT